MSPSASSSSRPINRKLRHQREQSAVIAMTEADALAAVATDTTTALKLAIIASDLRADLLRGQAR